MCKRYDFIRSDHANLSSSDNLIIVSGPTPNKALFKELVTPPWGLWFDGSSVFSSHIR